MRELTWQRRALDCPSQGILRPSVTVKVSGNQIIGTSGSANIDLRCGGTYQITIGIERIQKSRFIGADIWLYFSQCAFVYEE